MANPAVQTEELEFEITLSGSYWKSKTPGFVISIDNEPVEHGFVTAFPTRKGLYDHDQMSDTDRQNSLQTIKFKHTVTDGDHVLQVQFNNKDMSSDTIVYNGMVTQDLILHIESVKIDGVDLAQLIYTESLYYLDTPTEHHGETVEQITNIASLGYPGTWTLKFQSPFYLWLLERI